MVVLREELELAAYGEVRKELKLAAYGEVWKEFKLAAYGEMQEGLDCWDCLDCLDCITSERLQLYCMFESTSLLYTLMLWSLQAF